MDIHLEQLSDTIILLRVYLGNESGDYAFAMRKPFQGVGVAVLRKDRICIKGYMGTINRRIMIKLFERLFYRWQVNVIEWVRSSGKRVFVKRISKKHWVFSGVIDGRFSDYKHPTKRQGYQSKQRSSVQGGKAGSVWVRLRRSNYCRGCGFLDKEAGKTVYRKREKDIAHYVR